MAWLPILVFGSDPLRLDEYGSLWVADRPLLEVWKVSLEIQGQSPFYYLLLSFWRHYLLLPPRLLSILLSLISLYYVWRIAKSRQVNPWLICTCLLLCDLFIGAAVNIRPYSLAIATLVSAVYYLLRNDRAGQITGTILLVLTYYAHYVFLPVVLMVYGIWLCLSWHFSRILFSFVTFSCLSLPSIWQLDRLRGVGYRYAFLAMPTWHDLVMAYVEPISLLALILIAAGMVIAWQSKELQLNYLFFALVLILLPPIANFAITYVQGYSIFLPRYYSGMLLGQIAGLIITAGVFERYKTFTSLACFVILLLTGYQLTNDVDRSFEDWASVESELRKLGAEEQCHSFAFTGFVEASNLKNLSTDSLQSQFIYSPLSFNNFEAQLIPNSFMSSYGHMEFFRTEVAPHFDKKCLSLVTRNYPIVTYDEPYKFKMYEPSFLTMPLKAQEAGYEIKIARKGELSFVVMRKS